MKKLELLGQTHFTGGNTYHVAAALLDGKVIARVEYSYGYGEQWLYNLCDELSKVAEVNGLPTNKAFDDRYPLQPWQYIRLIKTNGFSVFQNCDEVKRKKDLTL